MTRFKDYRGYIKGLSDAAIDHVSLKLMLAISWCLHLSMFPDQPAEDRVHDSRRSSSAIRQAAAVASFAQRAFPYAYSGTEMVESAVRVYRVRLEPAFDRSVTERFPCASLEFHDARASRLELLRIRDEIVEGMQHWASLGVDIFAVEVRSNGSGVVVRTSQPDLAHAILILSNPSLVLIEQGTAVQPL